MAKRPPCGKPVMSGMGPTTDGHACAYERMAGKPQCGWHWLRNQPAQTQAQYAAGRLARVPEEARRARVDKSEWPEGERWCSGCQSMVPLFYVSGSRCASCTSEAAHAQRVEKVYGITSEEYAAMYDLQNGRCYICQRLSPSRRLAVDHDHDTQRVRGLLCPDPERGCNHAILGPLEASPGGALAAAKRMVEYLEDPPYDRITRGDTKRMVDPTKAAAKPEVPSILELTRQHAPKPPPF